MLVHIVELSTAVVKVDIKANTHLYFAKRQQKKTIKAKKQKTKKQKKNKITKVNSNRAENLTNDLYYESVTPLHEQIIIILCYFNSKSMFTTCNAALSRHRDSATPLK